MATREATNDDVDEVVRLAALMYASMGHDASKPEWVDAARHQFVTRVGSDLVVFVVDDADGRRLVASAAGTVNLRLPAPNNLSGEVGYVQWVATDEHARRQGHARAVMQALLDWYDERGVRVVELHATPDGEPLYRELGFTDDGPVALRRRSR